jgi:hypothetical protein
MFATVSSPSARVKESPFESVILADSTLATSFHACVLKMKIHEKSLRGARIVSIQVQIANLHRLFMREF